MELQDLSTEELTDINGGDNITQAIFWAAGYIAGSFEKYYPKNPNSTFAAGYGFGGPI